MVGRMLEAAKPRYSVQARSFGEILDLGFRLVRDHFALLMTISAAFYLPLGLVQMFLGSSAGGGGGTAAEVIGTMLLVLVVLPIVSVAVTYAVSEIFLGRSVTAGEAFRFSKSILMRLLGTAFLETVL